MSPLNKGWIKKLVMVTCFVFAGVILAGCTTDTSTPVDSPSPLPVTDTPAPKPTPSPNPTQAAPTPIPVTATPVVVTAACSPLQGISLDELDAITSFKFNSPSAYSDAFHPAVDLAFFSYKDIPTMRGLPVQALLPGRVALVINDRFPYGNMVLIETPLDRLQLPLQQSLALPTPIPQHEMDLFSTCDKDHPLIEWSADSKSLYTLYAHLNDASTLIVGDAVDCGQVIGSVGISGNSVADHLHLEVRLGPSDARFTTFAALRPEASSEEKYNYCIWNSSGYFQAIDPARFWN